MEKALISKYVSNFKRLVSPFLKKDVSLRAIVFPYKTGALMVFEFNYDGKGNTSYKAEVKNIQEAMKKSNLFVDPENASDIEGTKSVIDKNLFIVIKGEKTENWSSDSAKGDVIKFIDALENKNNGQN